jgi:hypothetical protein
MALDVIAYAMSGTGPYASTTINNGGALVGSPRGSGFLDTNYTLGEGYAGADTLASTLPSTGTVYATYDTRFTGCPPCI